MTNLIHYKDGQLTIPLESMHTYLELLTKLRLSILEIEEICLPQVERFIKLQKESSGQEGELDMLTQNMLTNNCILPPPSNSKSQDYIPFRILDGVLFPYFETCMGGDSPCLSYKKNSHGMKTFIGTIEILGDVSPTTLSSYRPLKPSRHYEMKDITGQDSKVFSKILGKFPKLFFEALEKGQDLTVPMTSHMYKLISVQSVESQKVTKSVAMDILLGESYFPSDIPSHPYFSSSDIHVTYLPNKEEFMCAHAITKVLSKKQKTDIKLEQNSAKAIKAIVEYLSKPLEIKYKIHLDYQESLGFSIKLPAKFSSYLGSKLTSNFREGQFEKGDSIEILLDANTSPELSSIIKNVIENDFEDALENISKQDEAELIVGCMIHMDLIG